MAWIGAVLLALLAAGEGAFAQALEDVAAEGEPVVWAGHQVVVGDRKVPLFGTVTTRTETFFLAEVTRRGEELVLRPSTCRIHIAPTAGVQVAFTEETARSLPVVPFRISSGKDGFWYAAPWQAGWGDEDVDGDGNPGASLSVRAPLCKGELYVATTSWSRARMRTVGGRHEGEIRVLVRQRTLGSSAACLSLINTDGDDRVKGTFAYVPVPAGTTCESLGERWPVRAEEPGA